MVVMPGDVKNRKNHDSIFAVNEKKSVGKSTR
jgi:hypothetical protein